MMDDADKAALCFLIGGTLIVFAPVIGTILGFIFYFLTAR